MTPRMVVGIFVMAVENTPTDRTAGQQQLDEMLQKHPRAPPAGRAADHKAAPPPPPPAPPAPPPPPPPAAPGNVARGLQVLLPWRDLGQRVAEAGTPAARRRI